MVEAVVKILHPVSLSTTEGGRECTLPPSQALLRTSGGEELRVGESMLQSQSRAHV